MKVNEHFQTVSAPGVLCLSQYDSVSLVDSTDMSAKSFHFDPWYIKACLKFDNLEDEIEIEEQYLYDRQMLYMFTRHHGNFQGIFRLTPQQYIHINELLMLIGAEVYSQSDGYWTCRIRRMLRQAINCIYDIYVDQRKRNFFELSENTNPVTICTDYIHTNYNSDITLNTLCRLVSLNRTTLNQKFKQQCGCTCIEYLLNYRLKMAQELLANTSLKVSEVAGHCGFKYDSYFIRQFTGHLGISPSKFRENALGYNSYEGQPLHRL